MAAPSAGVRRERFPAASATTTHTCGVPSGKVTGTVVVPTVTVRVAATVPFTMTSAVPASSVWNAMS